MYCGGLWKVYGELMGCFLGLGMELVEIECNLQKMGMNFMELRNMVYVGRLCGSGVGNVEGNILSSLLIVLGNVYGYMGII